MILKELKENFTLVKRVYLVIELSLHFKTSQYTVCWLHN